VSIVNWIFTGIPFDDCGVAGGNNYNENGYYCGDIQVLQDIIDINPSLNGQIPLEIGSQSWNESEPISRGICPLRLGLISIIS
jgi:hypothetical protein